MEAEESVEGKEQRNDQMIAIGRGRRTYAQVNRLDEGAEPFIECVESDRRLTAKDYSVLRTKGPTQAFKCIQRSTRATQGD